MTPINSTSHAALTPWSDSVGLDSLDPESLLVHCEVQMGRATNDIKALTHDQELLVRRKQALSSVQQELRKVEQGSSSPEQLKSTFEEAIDSLPENNPTRVELEKLEAELGLPGSGAADAPPVDMNLLKARAKTHVEDLGQKIDSVGGDAEINMIKLQAAVSSHQTIISMITNIMAKVQGAAKEITGNMR